MVSLKEILRVHQEAEVFNLGQKLPESLWHVAIACPLQDPFQEVALSVDTRPQTCAMWQAGGRRLDSLAQVTTAASRRVLHISAERTKKMIREKMNSSTEKERKGK